MFNTQHCTIACKREAWTLRESFRRPSSKGRDRAIVDQTNMETVSEATWGEILGAAHMGFAERIGTELNCTPATPNRHHTDTRLYVDRTNAADLWSTYSTVHQQFQTVTILTDVSGRPMVNIQHYTSKPQTVTILTDVSGRPMVNIQHYTS